MLTIIVVFFQSLDLSSNMNLRSIIVDSVLVPHSTLSQADDRFSPLISMLSRTTSPFLEKITLNLTMVTADGMIYPEDMDNVPWHELAQIFAAHSNSLASINIIVPGVLVGATVVSFQTWRAVCRYRIEMHINAGLNGTRLNERLRTIINISFP